MKRKPNGIYKSKSHKTYCFQTHRLIERWTCLVFLFIGLLFILSSFTPILIVHGLAPVPYIIITNMDLTFPNFLFKLLFFTNVFMLEDYNDLIDVSITECKEWLFETNMIST